MEEQKVSITNVDIPFGRMVIIIFKWMLASIPAAILMYAIMFGIMLVFGVGLGGCAALMAHP